MKYTYVYSTCAYTWHILETYAPTNTTYAYTHIHIHTHIHVYLHTYRNAYVFTNIKTYAQIRLGLFAVCFYSHVLFTQTFFDNLIYTHMYV